jgi:uncharacterized Zn-finger protein
VIASRFQLLDEITSAGGCSHPVRLKGEFVNTATGEVNQRQLRVACKDRRSVICPACSHLYQADAWIMVSAGMVGGKGVPVSVLSHPRVFMTLTAPSFGPVHTKRADGTCRLRSSSPCRHGVSMRCGAKHNDESLLLGTPLCAECFDYRAAVLWNAQSARLWNRTIQQVCRRLALSEGIAPNDFHHHARLSYVKVAEFQRRGLVHFHAILRVDGPGDPYSPPSEFLTTAILIEVITDVVSQFGVPDIEQGVIRWGRQFHVTNASDLLNGDLRIASYIAKYAVKTSTDGLDLARRFHHRKEIRGLVAVPHHQRLALTTWDLNPEPSLGDFKLRLHAHSFGYRGQFITKSRYYSTRFQDLRSARSAYMSRPDAEDLVAGSFSYEGRGYDDPRAAEVAELLHAAAVEVKKVRRAARLLSRGISHGTSPGISHEVAT